MLTRYLFTAFALLSCCHPLWAQAPAVTVPKSTQWKTSTTGGAAEPGAAAQDETGVVAPPLKQVKQTERRAVTKVTSGSGTLPNDQGQVWREYDISGYSKRVTSTNQPEQAIIDWILRETGYEAWHSKTVAMLSADSKTVRVYHTPEVQQVVADIVERFVTSEAETQAFGLRIVTMGNPNWRAKALRLMKPVPVQSQGVQGWLLAKEDAALLLTDLQRRTDYREHSSPHLLVHNGQSNIVSTIRPRTYVRNLVLSAGSWPGYEPEQGQIEEGFSLEFSPLMSLDGRAVDAIVKVRLSQIERMVPVMLEVPTTAAPRQRAQIEVPQVTMSNLHERFRWPTDQVLLLSMGVVATPAPGKGNPITDVLPIPKSPDRADALLFVECKGKVAPLAARPGQPAPGSYPQRY